MGWKDEQREREERTLAAVDRLAASIEMGVRELRARQEPVEPPVEPPWRFPALRIALRLCVDVEARDALVSRFRRVPAEFVDRSERVVRCPCGESHPYDGLVEGSCGRWLTGDESGVWAAKLDAPA